MLQCNVKIYKQIKGLLAGVIAFGSIITGCHSLLIATEAAESMRKEQD